MKVFIDFLLMAVIVGCLVANLVIMYRAVVAAGRYDKMAAGLSVVIVVLVGLLVWVLLPYSFSL